MKLRHIVKKNIEIISPDTPLREAAHKMSARNIAMLPVCDGQRIVGVLTARDLTVRATAQGRDPATSRVRDVMISPAIYCWEDQSIDEVVHLMYKCRLSRLPVLNRQMHVIGIVSLRDLWSEIVRRPKCRRSIK